MTYFLLSVESVHTKRFEFKYTLKRYVPTKAYSMPNNRERSTLLQKIRFATSNHEKSIPGMPLFDTFEQAVAYRTAICDPEYGGLFVASDKIAQRMLAVYESGELPFLYSLSESSI